MVTAYKKLEHRNLPRLHLDVRKLNCYLAYSDNILNNRENEIIDFCFCDRFYRFLQKIHFILTTKTDSNSNSEKF